MNRKLAAGLTGALALAGVTIAHFEGRSLVAYADPVGIPTICEGVTKGVKLGDTATHAQCDALLEREVRIHAEEVRRLVKVPMTDGTYAALTSFTYNVGAPALARSTLLRKLNAGDKIGACNELTKWVYAGGRKLRGLERRRAAERTLCLQ